MQRLLKGVLQFRDHAFGTKRELFRQLARGQSPQALFITCSDSRICPMLMTQADPGDLFVIRNAGNIVPAAGVGGGEAATIEYAIKALHIEHIVVCGHSHCGAMAGVLDHPGDVPGMPALSPWLRHAATARTFVAHEHARLPREQQLQRLIEANVLLQIEHLSTHPAVAEALARNQLDIHGWVYRFETGDVLSFDLQTSEFRPVPELLAEAGEDTPPSGLGPDMRSRPMFRAAREVEKS